MPRYRFGDPYAYKKGLYIKGAQFIIAWHLIAYSGFHWMKSKLSEEDKANWDRLSAGQKYIKLVGGKEDTQFGVIKIKPTGIEKQTMKMKEYVALPENIDLEKTDDELIE